MHLVTLVIKTDCNNRALTQLYLEKLISLFFARINAALTQEHRAALATTATRSQTGRSQLIRHFIHVL